MLLILFIIILNLTIYLFNKNIAQLLNLYDRPDYKGSTKPRDSSYRWYHNLLNAL